MSGQLKNNAGESKLRVTLLSAEWKTSSNGDLTTINRELAIQMAKHPNVEVSVFLPQCSEEDKKDADSYNVKLIKAVKLKAFEPVLWLASVPEGHAMDCVIGHGVALGRHIQLIKRNSNYSHCKWIQVVHTAPEEIGMYKNISKGQQKQQTEIELCKMADQVVTIGPKLTEAYKKHLRKQDVFNLTPSIFTEFSDVQQASHTRTSFCILVIESGDSEDFDVKGYNIAAKAIADLKNKSYQLKFASKQKGKEDELANRLLKCGIGRNQLSISSLDGNRETLANLFSVVDIAILPSKTEGFGLSALQAISAGLPVLVSGNSGIAEALKEVPNGSQCIVDSEDPADWARAIKAKRDIKRDVRLAEAKILRENYLQQFSWEKSCDVLVEKMYNLAFGNKQTWNSEHENGGACSSSVATTGHRKELKSSLPYRQEREVIWSFPGEEVEELRMTLQGMEGFWSFPGEEVEELHKKLQGMEGTSSTTVLSPAGHTKKVEVKHSTVKFQEKKSTSSATVLSTAGHTKKVEERHSTVKFQEKKSTSYSNVLSTAGYKKKGEVRHSSVNSQEKKRISSATVLSTAGHTKKVEERNSTVNSQEKKSTSNSTVLSPAGHTKKVEVRHNSVNSQEKKRISSATVLSTAGHTKKVEERHSSVNSQEKKSTSSATVLSPAGHTKKVEERHSSVNSQEKKSTSYYIVLSTAGHTKKVEESHSTVNSQEKKSISYSTVLSTAGHKKKGEVRHSSANSQEKKNVVGANQRVQTALKKNNDSVARHDSDNEDRQSDDSASKKSRGLTTGLNLSGFHERYEGVLDILTKKKCSLAKAMREYGVPRNTLTDYTGICELKIIDPDKYKTVVQQESGKSGKASVKSIENSCRLALEKYRAQANKMKREGKLLPF